MTTAARDLPTIFVFIIGGATYSELKTVYKVYSPISLIVLPLHFYSVPIWLLYYNQIAEENKNYDFFIG